MCSQTLIFSKLVKDFMRPPPPALGAAAACSEAANRMAANEASSVMVIDADGRPIGIVTEQDIARRAAFRLAADTPVADVMTSPVLSIPDDEYLYHAIARMRRHGLRHMPVVDAAGMLRGMLDLHDALAVAGEQLMGQIDSLTREDSIEGMKKVKAAQVELADQLFKDGLQVSRIQALLTHVNNDIYRRVVDFNLAAMEAEGYGQPPVGFCVIVMGSGGRGENYLFPDQDNGFIIDDYPDGRHTGIDAWFIDLAERMTRDLDAVGLPLCRGYVMATNPLWRKTLSQWKEQIRLWGRRRSTVSLRLCDIFFDYRGVAGDIGLARQLRHHVIAVASGNHALLRGMYEDNADHRVALGLFDRFITERDRKEYKGQLNLKYTGTLPLVEAVRLLALREGVEAVPTLGRLDALHDLGVLDDDQHDYLSGALLHIARLLLRQQIADFKAGNKVSTYVDPKTLTEREKDILVDSFKAIQELQNRVRAEFTADIF